ncbi:MAG: hypothetical protein AAB198_03680 [Actinomycetota bacterium]
MLAPLIAQVDESEGFALPSDVGTTLIWVVFFAMVAGLWTVLARTRRKTEEAYRRRAEKLRDRPDLE